MKFVLNEPLKQQMINKEYEGIVITSKVRTS